MKITYKKKLNEYEYIDDPDIYTKDYGLENYGTRIA